MHANLFLDSRIRNETEENKTGGDVRRGKEKKNEKGIFIES